MTSFVDGVLSSMVFPKVTDENDEAPVFEPVAMREVSEEEVTEILSKAGKTLKVDDTLLKTSTAAQS